jgi:hypothetical protein
MKILLRKERKSHSGGNFDTRSEHQLRTCVRVLIVGHSFSLECASRCRRHSLATNAGLRRIPSRSFVKDYVAVAAEGYSCESRCAYFWYGVDAILFGEHCACRDGKRLRRTRRLLRKSHIQWRASKLFSDDRGSSPITIWRAGSRLSR